MVKAADVNFSGQDMMEKADSGQRASSAQNLVNDNHYHKHLLLEKFVKLWQRCQERLK